MVLFLGLSIALLSLIAAVSIILIIKYVFLIPLDETLSESQQLCFQSPISTTPVQPPSLLDGSSPQTKSLSIVIPAYNEEMRLPATLEETMQYLQNRRAKRPAFTYEVIVVDDGSSDSTSTVAFEFVKKHGIDAVRLLSLRSNKGKGYAVKAGIMCSRGKRVLFMDADGATAISEVEKLEKRMDMSEASEVSAGVESKERIKGDGDREKAILVVGSRAHLQNTATAKRTALRNFLMHGFHALVTMVVGNEIRDTQCGFKLMTRKAAQMIVPQQRLQRWAFDVELVKLGSLLGVEMHEEQVVWTEIPGSKVRLSSIVHIAFELLLIKVGYDVLRTWGVVRPSELFPGERPDWSLERRRTKKLA
jgi:dolichyl-phosphate beta-glucosyltransferase